MTPYKIKKECYLFYLFIYLFLAVLGLRFCARAFSSCGERGPLFIAVRRPLTIAASLVAEHRLQTRRLSSCGSRAQLLRGMWDHPRPGLEPASPAPAGRLNHYATREAQCYLLNCPIGAMRILFSVVEQVFLPMGEVWSMPNADTQCTVKGRKEAKGKRKMSCLDFSCLAIKYEVYFIYICIYAGIYTRIFDLLAFYSGYLILHMNQSLCSIFYPIVYMLGSRIRDTKFFHFSLKIWHIS